MVTEGIVGNHTPGAWALNMYAESKSGFVQHRIESANDHGWSNDGFMIAAVDGPDAEANGRLIAAAPAMFEALQALIKEPHGCVFCDSGKLRNPARDHEETCGFAKARAALSQASSGETEGGEHG